MRTYVLIIATLGILGSAFYFYSREQTASVATKGPLVHPSEPVPATLLAGNSSLRKGEIPWVKFINAQGKVGSQYRAVEYLPRPDGTVHLISPEADFFVGEHERLHVTGVNGDVVMHSSTSISLTGNSQPSGQPTRGRLNDVHMTLIDETFPAHPVVVLTMTSNNIEFDNDSFLITTGGYTSPDGNSVAPDQVPVQVRGEYAFDGRGLTLRWNDQDDRLELLEIAHGEMLTILHPSNRNGPLGDGATRPPTAPAPAGAPALVANTPIAPPAQAAAPSNSQTLVPANGAATTPGSTVASGGAQPPVAGASGTAPAGNSAKRVKPIYLATFDRDVRITQGNDLLMTGDVLRMHFRMKDQPEPAATQPSNASSPHANVPMQEPFAGIDGSRRKSVCQPTDSPPVTSPQPGNSGRSPATDPGLAIASDVPIVVRWTGRLLIVPETGPPPRPIGQGESVMELVGQKSAVYAFHAATEDSPASRIKCTKLTYATVDGSALLESSPEFGQVQVTREPLPTSLDDDPMQPTVITTDTLAYVPSAHMTNLKGHGRAVIPTAPNPGEKQAAIDATWSKNAHFDFFPRSGNEMAIQSAIFDGDVKIDHPQLKLTAQELILAFSPLGGDAKSAQGSAPPLSEVKASDYDERVDCRMVDSAGKTQEVKSHFLDLHTARTSDNRVLARQVDAAGNVDATDGTQELLCDRVRMMLRPSTAAKQASPPDAQGGVDTSAVELDRMDARGNVIVRSKDGSNTRSDDLLVAMDPDGPHVMMTGNTLSKVIDAKKDILSGEKIVIQPHQQIAHVIGSGTIHSPGTQSGVAANAATSRKMDVIFSEGADLDGGSNQINLRGHPVVTMPDSDGTINTAQADRIKIDLEDKPKAASQPAAAKPASGGSNGGAAPSEDANLLGNKEAKLITLDGNAVVQSTLSDATGILRQRELKAPTVFYSVTGTPEIAPRTLLVPSPGVMLVRDHREPATAPAAGGDDTGLGNGRGTTAFKWTRKLTYSEDARRAVMSGDVLVAHESDNPKELPVNMTADEMTADFTPASAKNPSGQPPAANGTRTGAGAMELKSLEAVGNVAVNRGPEQLAAPRIYFEPASHWMIATGTSQIPATMTDAQGAQTSALQMRWNTDTWDFSMKQASGEGRR